MPKLFDVASMVNGMLFRAVIAAGAVIPTFSCPHELQLASVPLKAVGPSFSWVHQHISSIGLVSACCAA